jgi:hypothetical protein
MKTIRAQTLFARGLVAGLIALTLSLSAEAAPPARKGNLNVTKECSENTGAPGSFCTITSSNLAEIKVGSKIFYDQAAGVPTGLLDSAVILDAGDGNRALGRCTLDFGTTLGLCTFSDGTGQFAGFHARVDVSLLPDFSGFLWLGTYSFTKTD